MAIAEEIILCPVHKTEMEVKSFKVVDERFISFSSGKRIREYYEKYIEYRGRFCQCAFTAVIEMDYNKIHNPTKETYSDKEKEEDTKT